MSLGSNIAEARKQRNLTQEKLAELVGVSFQAVSSWERDENLPDTARLLSLAKALDTSLDALFSIMVTDWKSSINDKQGLIERAIEFATVKHAGIKRKGTSIPYVTHVVEALAIVSTLSEDEEVRAAAVLHDTLEDTETTKEELIRNFGERVADLVASESENKREDQPAELTWDERKGETIKHLSSASLETKIIALGDKLSNIRAISRDYEKLGDALWERFNQKESWKHGWYYGSIANIFGAEEKLKDTAAFHEYVKLVRSVFDDGEGSDAPDPEDDNSLKFRFFYKDTMDEERKKVSDGMIPWALILDRPKDEDTAEFQKMAVVLDALLRTDDIGFGNVHLVIENDPDSEDVSWERTEDGYKIHLCVEDGKYWCQSAYQMGYALMHCLIDHTRGGEKINWVEELICETTALELLYELTQHWEETPFWAEDPEYGKCIDEYIKQNQEDRGTAALLRCRDWNELVDINNRNDFDDRLDESHDLFQMMSHDDLARLAQVRHYAADNLLLHTHYWRGRSNGSKVIDYICRLQERIPDCEVPNGVSHDINLVDSKPTDAQLKAFEYMIRSLRDLPYEHVCFTFRDPDKGDREQIGLVFFQAVRGPQNTIVSEMRVDTRKGRKMYRIRTDEDQAIAFLNEIIIMDEVPDIREWKDITKIVF